MKSLALTLAVLFGTLSLAQAADQAQEATTEATTEDIIAVEETTEIPTDSQEEETAQ